MAKKRPITKAQAESLEKLAARVGDAFLKIHGRKGHVEFAMGEFSEIVGSALDSIVGDGLTKTDFDALLSQLDELTAQWREDVVRWSTEYLVEETNPDA